MSSGPRIPKAAKGVIAQLVRDNPNASRATIREKAKPQIAGLVSQMPQDETIEKLISWVRNHAPHPEDAPWSMAASGGIQPEALPWVLRIWKQRQECDEALSIREAKWIARLYILINPEDTDLDTLWGWAMIFAGREWVWQMFETGKPFDTSELDASLFEAAELQYEPPRLTTPKILVDRGYRKGGGK